MSVRRLFLLLFCCNFLPMAALAADPYNYISAEALEARLTAKEPTHLVDIQVAPVVVVCPRGAGGLPAPTITCSARGLLPSVC